MHARAHFIQRSFLALLVVSCGLPVNAWSAAIQISGTVKSSLGPSIKLAGVKLLHNGDSTSTASNGSFSFSGTTGVVKTMTDQSKNPLSIFAQGNSIYFSTLTAGEMYLFGPAGYGG